MSGFQSLKKNRQSQLANLTQQLEKSQQTNNYEDERMWKVTRDKSGTGSAIIRFLPPSDGESTPWVRLFTHGFQGPGGWYIENSRTTINEKDPVSEFNSSLWNNGTDAGKDQARKQKRRLEYYSNILILEDPANPANNGQVKLFKYGKKIHEKITDIMSPEFADETPVNPFDLVKNILGESVKTLTGIPAMVSGIVLDKNSSQLHKNSSSHIPGTGFSP